jgi:hypothetical protein
MVKEVVLRQVHFLPVEILPLFGIFPPALHSYLFLTTLKGMTAFGANDVV